MVPNQGLYRAESVVVDSCGVAQLVYNSVVGLVLGVLVMLSVDMLLGSSARNEAKQRLRRGIIRAKQLVAAILMNKGKKEQSSNDVGDELDLEMPPEPTAQRDEVMELLLEDVDALRKLVPYAEAEPKPAGQVFPSELYLTIEAGLRKLATQMATVAWATETLDERSKLLRTGDYVLSSTGTLIKKPQLSKTWQKEEQHASQTMTGLLQSAALSPILGTVEKELQLMLGHVLTMAEVVPEQRWLPTKPLAKDAEAERVRAVLQANLYTRKMAAVFRRVAVSPWKIAKHSHSAQPNLPQAGKDSERAGFVWQLLSPGKCSPTATGQSWFRRRKSLPELPTHSLSNTVEECGTLNKLADGPTTLRRSISDPEIGNKAQIPSSPSAEAASVAMPLVPRRRRLSTGSMIRDIVYKAQLALNEQLEGCEPLPVTQQKTGNKMMQADDNSQVGLLALFQNLRKAAISQRGDLPQTDTLTLVEVMIFLLSSAQSEVQKLQLALLEY